MGDLTIFNDAQGAIPDYGEYDKNAIDVFAGMTSSTPFLKAHGKEFVIKMGSEKISVGLKIPVVIVAAGPLSKKYYSVPFSDNADSHTAPDCASADGETPDSCYENPQNLKCSTCQKNAWGSDDPTSKRKACAEYRRLACIVSNNGEHTLYRLDVPATSLKNLSVYGAALKIRNIPLNAVVTSISFDKSTIYGKFEFDAIKTLSSEQAKMFGDMRGDQKVVELLTAQVRLNDDDEAEQPTPKTPEPKPEKPATMPTVNNCPDSSEAIIITSAQELESELDSMTDSGVL